MDDPTQAPEPSESNEIGEPGEPYEPSPPPPLAPGEAPPMDVDDIRRGLWVWLGILIGGGITCLVLDHVEGAALFAGAGAFALAQATDAAALLERYRRMVDARFPLDRLPGRIARAIASALVPVGGAIAFAGLAAYAATAIGESPVLFAATWCVCAACLCAALAWRPFADAVTQLLFRGTGRTRRLTARLVVMALLIVPPALQLMPSMLASLSEGGTTLADGSSLTAQLLGELAIAFAGVGLFVRRDFRTALERLGLTAMRPRDWAVVVAGIGAAIALNGVTTFVEQHVFPGLFKQDEAITKLIAGHLSVATALLLGVSAGVGEEILVRGALQPRLGILLSSLVFAAGHVQYSWFGMLTVGLLGVILGFIRKKTNTTTVVVVHALYDIFAVLTT